MMKTIILPLGGATIDTDIQRMVTPVKYECIERTEETKIGINIGTLVRTTKEARRSLLKDLSGMLHLQKILG